MKIQRECEIMKYDNSTWAFEFKALGIDRDKDEKQDDGYYYHLGMVILVRMQI